MSNGSPYPTQQQQQQQANPIDPTRQIITSSWQVLEQPPPPTLREILNAYKSKGDGDREMLLAMLNAKSSEDQRIAATATLHHRLLQLPPVSPSSPSSTQSPYGSSHYSHPTSSSSSSRRLHHHHRSISPLASPQSVTLPPIHLVSQQNPHPHPHKRPRSSQSPPPYHHHHHHQHHPNKRRHSPHSPDPSMAPNLNEQLPPSPPFSSPGRSSASSELTAPHTHSNNTQVRGDAMAIGSLLTSEQERHSDSEWPSRTSAERDRERDDATYHKPTTVSR